MSHTPVDVAQLDPKKLKVGLALSYLGTMIRENAYADAGYTQAQRDEFDGCGILDPTRKVRGRSSAGDSRS